MFGKSPIFVNRSGNESISEVFKRQARAIWTFFRGWTFVATFNLLILRESRNQSELICLKSICLKEGSTIMFAGWKHYTSRNCAAVKKYHERTENGHRIEYESKLHRECHSLLSGERSNVNIDRFRKRKMGNAAGWTSLLELNWSILTIRSDRRDITNNSFVGRYYSSVLHTTVGELTCRECNNHGNNYADMQWNKRWWHLTCTTLSSQMTVSWIVEKARRKIFFSFCLASRTRDENEKNLRGDDQLF